MIVKIQPPAGNLTRAVAYNENKMSSAEGVLSDDEALEYGEAGNTGHVVATRGVPDVSTLENEFERLQMKNRRTTRGRKLENPVFHMSVNPGVLDREMSEADAAAFVDELMERLGYGDSPYRIFRHDDTGRTHYHVVSTRIGQDGKKIPDSFENRRCEKACRELAQKYGFIYGLQEEEENPEERRSETPSVSDTEAPYGRDDTTRVLAAAQEKKTPEKADKKAKKYIPPFDRDSDIPVSQQYTVFHNETMTWAFTTPEQYAAIMAHRFHTKAEIYGDEEQGLVFTGLGRTGTPAAPPITESQLGITALDDILARCVNTDMRKRKAQRKRLQDKAVEAAEQAATWDEFRALMRKQGIFTVMSWTKDGEPFGVTWLDRATKCAWKGSETDADLKWLKGVAEGKGWILSRPAPTKRKKTPKAAAKGSGHMPNSLSAYNDGPTLKKLLEIRGTQSRRSNADASRGGSGIKYGREDDNDVKI